MEDPITFDVWGTVLSPRPPEARSVLQRINPELSDKAVLQALTNAAHTNEPMLLASNLGWRALEVVRAELEHYFGAVEASQSGCGPSKVQRMKYCLVHRLYYGGIFGCHVCEGRNAP